jgi:hypothetical protein
LDEYGGGGRFAADSWRSRRRGESVSCRDRKLRRNGGIARSANGRARLVDTVESRIARPFPQRCNETVVARTAGVGERRYGVDLALLVDERVASHRVLAEVTRLVASSLPRLRSEDEWVVGIDRRPDAILRTNTESTTAEHDDLADKGETESRSLPALFPPRRRLHIRAEKPVLCHVALLDSDAGIRHLKPNDEHLLALGRSLLLVLLQATSAETRRVGGVGRVDETAVDFVTDEFGRSDGLGRGFFFSRVDEGGRDGNLAADSCELAGVRNEVADDCTKDVQ